jgi:hypothetical protein
VPVCAGVAPHDDADEAAIAMALSLLDQALASI